MSCPKKALQRTQRGPVTLVFGAGLSRSYHLPVWPELVRNVRLSHGLPDLDWLRPHADAPESSGPSWEGPGEPRLPHPLAYQIALEEVEEALRDQRRSELDDAEGSECFEFAKRRLEQALRSALYSGLSLRPSLSAAVSLDVIAHLVRQDRLSSSPRILRVITFNADDILEQRINLGHDFFRSPAAWPVACASDHPRRRDGADGKPPTTIYHLHGFLPQDPRQRAAPDQLVFTDAQYWESVASPNSFANRVMASALHDSYCLFIGLSMSDVNLMRWLGMHFGELVSSKLSQSRRQGWTPQRLQNSIREAERHYWIRTPDADPTGLISSHLRRRGVGAIPIEN